MSRDFEVFSDVSSFAVGLGIDSHLRRHGDYRDHWGNKVASAGGGAFMGAVGTFLGGPVLGVILAGLGHAMGQGFDFGGTSESEAARMGLHFVTILLDYGARTV